MYELLTVINRCRVMLYHLSELIAMPYGTRYFERGMQTMSNQVLKTLLYVLLGILQSIKIILGSFPDDKRAQDIITVLTSLITLIQDALEQPEMWLD